MSLGWVEDWGGLEGDYWVGFLLWGVGWFPFFCYWGVFSCVGLRLGDCSLCVLVGSCFLGVWVGVWVDGLFWCGGV